MDDFSMEELRMLEATEAHYQKGKQQVPPNSTNPASGTCPGPAPIHVVSIRPVHRPAQHSAPRQAPYGSSTSAMPVAARSQGANPVQTTSRAPVAPAQPSRGSNYSGSSANPFGSGSSNSGVGGSASSNPFGSCTALVTAVVPGKENTPNHQLVIPQQNANSANSAQVTATCVESPLHPLPVIPSIQYMRQYADFAPQILDRSDFAEYSGKRFIKKSGWRKISFAFGASFTIRERNIERDDQGMVTRAEFTVRASLPDGRFCDGWGACDRFEKRFNKARAGPQPSRMRS